MRALALTALWAGRLVDDVRCGALSTGVAAGSRVLQNLAALVGWLVAGVRVTLACPWCAACSNYTRRSEHTVFSNSV